MNVLIIGKSGRLAQACIKHIGTHSLSVRQDDSAYEFIRDYIAREKIEAIVNCSGFTDVDAAEIKKVECYSINVALINILVNAAESFQIPLVHYSTDFVFGELPTDPRVRSRVLTQGYSICDLPNPMSHYGYTKHTSELLVRNYKKGVVLRTCGIYSQYKEDFLSKFLGRLPDDLNVIPDLPVVINGYCNPTAADDIAYATNLVLKQGVYGLLHIVSPEPASIFDFFRTALIMYGHESAALCIRLASLADVKGLHKTQIAARPTYSVLYTGQADSYGIEMPSWRQSLWKYIEGYKERKKLPRNSSGLEPQPIEG